MKTNFYEILEEPDNNHFTGYQMLSDKLIGCEKELKKLTTYLNDVSKSKGRFVILNGEAGIGKSTLMAYFAEQARNVGFSIHSIKFRNTPIYDPYHPFLTLVDKFNGDNLTTNHNPSEDFTDFNTKNIDDDSDSLHILQDRYTFIRQYILSKLIKETQETPLLIEFDDLHLASQTTWQFIHYITEKITDQKVFLLGSLRQDGRAMAQTKIPPYVKVLQRMSREDRVEKIKLSRFTRDHVRKYLTKRYAKSDFSSEFISFLHQTCNGIPEKLEIYTDILEKKGFVYCEQGIWYNPDQMNIDEMGEAAIQKSEMEDTAYRIEKLSPAHLRLLKYSSLINETFDHCLMAEITKRPKVTVLKDLIYLSSQKLLLNLENEQFQFKYTSTLLTIKKKIKTSQTAAMHKKIAETLEQTNQIRTNKKVYLLAHHYSHTKYKDRAFRYLFLAGNMSMVNLAFQEANILYQQALSLADYVPQNKRLINLYLRCAWNDRLLGSYEQSLEYSMKAFELAERDNRQIEKKLILLQRAFTYFRLRDWDKCIADFEECLKDKKNLSPFSQATTHYGLASTNFEMGKYNDSRKHFEEALTIVQKLYSKSSVIALYARILNNLGALESVTGNHMQAIRRYSQSIPLYEKINDNYGLAQVYNNIGLTYAEGHSWAEANGSYGKSLSYCDQVGNLPLKSFIFLNRAYAFTQLDKFAEAEEYNTKAYRLVKKINDQLSIAEFHKIQGIVERKGGHWINAIHHFDTALDKFKSLNNMLGYAESAYERGLLALDMNDEKDFNKWLKLSLRNYRELGLGKRVTDISNTLNGHLSKKSAPNLRKKNASVKSL